METTLTVIPVDLSIILRVVLAFGWGIGWAAYIELHRHGQFLATERTWITVVIGVGVDLAIAWPGDWYVVTLVISASSIGIIARSLMNEQKAASINWQGYKVKHGLEDAAAIVGNVIRQLQTILDKNNLPAGDVANISRALNDTHKLKETIIAARRGETLSK